MAIVASASSARVDNNYASCVISRGALANSVDTRLIPTKRRSGEKRLRDDPMIIAEK